MNHWPFDQAANVAAITTRQVADDGHPVLVVIHYEEDDSWAFLSDSSIAAKDGRVIGMGEALKIDETLASIADLPPGWQAHRVAIGKPWHREINPVA